jgi:hypothetical protein
MGTTTKPQSILDVIKPILDQMTQVGNLSVFSLLLAMGISLLAGLFIFYIYKRTFNGVLYSRSFNTSLVLLTLVTALIIRVISSNLTLSLGMVGALSIVRFRTAVKEAMDTVFMFWAVGTGIVIGAGDYYILFALISTALIGVILYFISLAKGKGSFPYLLIIRHDFNCAGEVTYALHKLPRSARLKSKTVTQNGVEITMEVRLPGENTTLVNDFLRINGVFDATLVSFQGDYGA